MIGKTFKRSTPANPEPGEDLFRVGQGAISQGNDVTLNLFTKTNSAMFELTAMEAIELGHQLQLAGHNMTAFKEAQKVRGMPF